MPALPILRDSGEPTYIEQVIASNNGRPGALPGIPGAVQEHHAHKYLSPEALQYVAAKLDIRLSRIYSFAIFYALFNARLIEVLYALEHIEVLLSLPEILHPHVRATADVNALEGVGVIEAPRGTLIHHYKVDENGAMFGRT